MSERYSELTENGNRTGVDSKGREYTDMFWDEDTVRRYYKNGDIVMFRGHSSNSLYKDNKYKYLPYDASWDGSWDDAVKIVENQR